MRHLRFMFLAMIGAAFTVALVYCAYLIFYYHKQISFPEDSSYLLNQGDTVISIANQFHDQGLILEPYSLVILSRLTGKAGNLKAGEYEFINNSTIKTILNQLVEGKVVEHKVTLLEGWTFKQFRAALNKSKKLSHVTESMTDEQIMAAVGMPDSHPEGWFFPDTYIYNRSASDLKILKQAHEKMKAELDRVWQQRDESSLLTSPYEALIMASLIEKETNSDKERKLVSGVFENRMKKGMRLQTDPTVIYGMGDSFDGNLKRSHLKNSANIYNTYVIPRLTPTPISMPGQSSLEAAVMPEQSEYLFFVAKGDGTFEHTFTKNYKAHRAAIKVYHKNLKQRSLAESEKEKNEDE